MCEHIAEKAVAIHTARESDREDRADRGGGMLVSYQERILGSKEDIKIPGESTR